MSATVSLTESQVLIALRRWIRSVLDSNVAVVEGQINRVVSPIGDYVVMTPMLRRRLSQSVEQYEDDITFGVLGAVGVDGVTHPLVTTDGLTIDASPRPPGLRKVLEAIELTVQCDVHGPNAPQNVQILSTLAWDQNGFESFETSGYDVQILHAEDPKQVPFITSESQYETRWSVDVVMQMNPVVTVAQTFADEITVVMSNVDDILQEVP